MGAKLTHPSFYKYISALEKLDCDAISDVIEIIAGCLNRGGAIFTAGNGGSYSIAQHFAADLRGPIIEGKTHYREAEARRIVHLGSNLAEFTALCNDVGYNAAIKYLAMREGVCKRDVLILFSVSGTSPNMANAINYCRLIKDCSIILISSPVKYPHAPIEQIQLETTEVGNDWYGVVEGVFSCIAHEIANRVKERLNEKDS